MEFNVKGIPLYFYGTAFLPFTEDECNDFILTCAHNLVYYIAEEGELTLANKITLILGKY
jgi:hypothetical protein